MSNKKTITLDVGIQIPQIGLGTFSFSEPGEVKKAVIHALNIGYRHLDTAKVYQNQVEVAEGIEASAVKREEIFITSKLWNTAHRPGKVAEALDDTLKELKTNYLDLYLVHWPVAFASTAASADSAQDSLCPIAEDGKHVKLDLGISLVDTWKEMIKLKGSGKVKAIGVSNFTAEHIDGLIKATGVKPSVNQIERHPLLPQPELIKFCDSHGIHVTAYSPLGNNFTGKTKIVDYPEIKEIAKRLSVDPAQVLIAWGIRGGTSVIPKSVTPLRIESNFKLIELSDEDYEKVCNLGGGKTVRFNIPKTTMPSEWDINVFNTEAEKTATHEVKIF